MIYWNQTLASRHCRCRLRRFRRCSDIMRHRNMTSIDAAARHSMKHFYDPYCPIGCTPIHVFLSLQSPASICGLYFKSHCTNQSTWRSNNSADGPALTIESSLIIHVTIPQTQPPSRTHVPVFLQHLLHCLVIQSNGIIITQPALMQHLDWQHRNMRDRVNTSVCTRYMDPWNIAEDDCCSLTMTNAAIVTHIEQAVATAGKQTQLTSIHCNKFDACIRVVFTTFIVYDSIIHCIDDSSQI